MCSSSRPEHNITKKKKKTEACNSPRPVAPARARAQAQARGGDWCPSGTGRRRAHPAGVAPAGSSATGCAGHAEARVQSREPGVCLGTRRRLSREVPRTRRRRARPCVVELRRVWSSEPGRARVSKRRKRRIEATKAAYRGDTEKYYVWTGLYCS